MRLVRQDPETTTYEQLGEELRSEEGEKRFAPSNLGKGDVNELSHRNLSLRLCGPVARRISRRGRIRRDIADSLGIK